MISAHAIEAAIALSLLHSLWQDALLALIAACALALQSQCSAGARHATAMAFLLAMVAAPLLTFACLVADRAVAAGGAAIPLPLHDVPALLPNASAIAASHWLPGCWAAGVVLMLARLAGGWRLVHALARARCDALPARWSERCEALRQAMGIRRRVAIRLLEGVSLPLTARAWRPIVWLPIAMMTRLPPDQIEALIAHELAHVRRLDWVWNGLQCIVEALLFHHPAVWWLGRRIRQEREHACDDLAVAVCGDAIALAEALGALEGLRAPFLIPSLSADGGSLMKRIAHLLAPESRSGVRWGAPLGLIAVLCSGTLLAANVTPDAGVRAWIDKTDTKASTIPAQSTASGTPSMPPVPLISDSEAFKAAVASVQQAPRLVAVLGTPIVATGAVRGRLSDANLFGPAGADLRIGLTGPKGMAVLEARGTLDGRSWKFSALNVTPDHGSRMDLAARP